MERNLREKGRFLRERGLLGHREIKEESQFLESGLEFQRHNPNELYEGSQTSRCRYNNAFFKKAQGHICMSSHPQNSLLPGNALKNIALVYSQRYEKMCFICLYEL